MRRVIMLQQTQDAFWEFMRAISFGLVRKEHRELTWLILGSYALLISLFLLAIFGTNPPPR